MAVTLTIRDETTAGAPIAESPLEFPTERITIRDLIRARIYQEVQDFNRNQQQGRVFHGLVRPADAERVGTSAASGYRLPPTRAIDWQTQFELAVAAFDRLVYFILVDDHQAESLDQELTIRHNSVVTFVRLVPLVGG